MPRAGVAGLVECIVPQGTYLKPPLGGPAVSHHSPSRSYLMGGDMAGNWARPAAAPAEAGTDLKAVAPSQTEALRSLIAQYTAEAIDSNWIFHSNWTRCPAYRAAMNIACIHALSTIDYALSGTDIFDERISSALHFWTALGANPSLPPTATTPRTPRRRMYTTRKPGGPTKSRVNTSPGSARPCRTCQPPRSSFVIELPERQKPV